MNTSASQFDTIEQLIFNEGLRIESVEFPKGADTLKVVLNTNVALEFPLSSFKRLNKVPEAALRNYVLTSGGTGVHWPALDEDLSLKGFLQESLRKAVGTAA